MRLVCPNCSAQYEVDDSAIPQEGRDVQCANCGVTWFQDPASARDRSISVPVAREPLPEPDPQQVDPDVSDDEGENERPSREAPSVDPTILDILRSEAELEASREAGQIESDPLPEPAPEPDRELQAVSDVDPDPEIDFTPDLPEVHEEQLTVQQRARAARERLTARRDGAGQNQRAAPAGEPKQEQDQDADLPDVENLNSSLRPASETREDPPAQVRNANQNRGRRKSRFGFYLSIMIALILLGIFHFERQIVTAVPQSEPYLTAYVNLVNQARHWLDGFAESVVKATVNLLQQYL